MIWALITSAEKLAMLTFEGAIDVLIEHHVFTNIMKDGETKTYARQFAAIGKKNIQVIKKGEKKRQR